MKATGSDEIGVEELQIELKTLSEILSEQWRKCWALELELSDWSETVLVSLCKKGDRASPEVYCSIALLCYMRKVIDSANAMKFRKEYKFGDCQPGFKLGTETKTAIVKHISNAKHMKVAAVLGLKPAYDSVLRDKL